MYSLLSLKQYDPWSLDQYGTTLRLHYNAVSTWLPNIFPVYCVWKRQQTIAVYTMQAVKIVLPVYFVAMFDTS